YKRRVPGAPAVLAAGAAPQTSSIAPRRPPLRAATVVPVATATMVGMAVPAVMSTRLGPEMSRPASVVGAVPAAPG
ncbi:hypothetical protein, partial [Mycobacterium marinum]|uniref:hypothetical protein n=1 Tax=Mycobacterium marinum TaxID=1781 RepID=UPI003F68E56E